MAMRYVVTSRIPGAEVSLPEDDQVTVVAPPSSNAFRSITAVQAPVRVAAGRPIDVLASVRDGRGPVSGLKAAATVAAPRRPIGDVLQDHADQLRKVRLPAGLKADGKPDKGRLALTRLVLLRDRLAAKAGEDILAPVVTSLAMSAPSTRPRPARTAGSPSRGRSPVDGSAAVGPPAPRRGAWPRRSATRATGS